MLFKFNYFWKCLLIFLGAWTLYGLVGYEFTVVTLLAAIITTKASNSTHLF